MSSVCLSVCVLSSSGSKVLVHFVNQSGVKSSVFVTEGETLLDVVIKKNLDISGFGNWDHFYLFIYFFVLFWLHVINLIPIFFKCCQKGACWHIQLKKTFRIPNCTYKLFIFAFWYSYFIPLNTKSFWVIFLFYFCHFTFIFYYHPTNNFFGQCKY